MKLNNRRDPMKSGLALLILFTTSFASAASFKLPSGYKGVLDCRATKKSPALMVAKSNKGLFLAAKVSSSVALFSLQTVNADMGYLAYEADDLPASLKKIVDTIYIYNNEEDIDDPADAIITGGAIDLIVSDTAQDCKVLGSFTVN